MPRGAALRPARCARPKMAAPMCRRGLGPRVSGPRGGPGVSGWGPWFPSHAASPTGSVLEPTAAVYLERPAHLRGPLQGERGRVQRRGDRRGAGPGCWRAGSGWGARTHGFSLLLESRGQSPCGQGGQASDLRGGARASPHRPPQGLAVVAHR